MHTEHITGNNVIAWNKKLDNEVTEVTEMRLAIQRWSHTGRQVKILEFFTNINEIYEGDDIFSINLVEEKETSHGSLPVGNISSNEITISLSNENRKYDAGNRQSSLYNLVKPNRRMKAWIGTEDELIPLGTFWTGDWSVPESDIYAKTTGRDRLDQLRATKYSTSTVQVNVTAYDLFEDILRDAELLVGEYWIDPSLEDIVFPYSYFDETSHREALRIVAEATLSQVFCDREGILRIEGVEYVESTIVGKNGRVFLRRTIPGRKHRHRGYGISSDDYYTKDNPPKLSDISNRIEVETQPLVPQELQEVYKSNDSITVTTAKTFTIFYNSTPCIDAVLSLEGTGTIESVIYYAWGRM